MKKIILMTALIATAITLNSCDDDNNSNSGDYAYKVRLTDAPGPFSEVNVDIRSVQVITADGETINLNTQSRVYNLLDYRNGENTVIASRNLTTAQVSKVRLVLGTNNTVVMNGVSYPLSTSGVDQSGLTVTVNQTLDDDDENTVLIDFDANASIMQTGATTFKLRPIVRNVDLATTGKIEGSITGGGVLTMVTATSSTDVEYTSNASSNGNFQIRALPSGNYTLTVTPLLPLLPITQTNVSVQAGASTNVGVITF